MGSVRVVILRPEVEPAEIAHLALLDLMPVLFDTTRLRFSSYHEEVEEVP